MICLNLMSSFEKNSIDYINQIVEQDDISEISSLFSLFCYNNKIMPGSIEFDEMLALTLDALGSKICSDTIIKFRGHIDEYE